MKKINEFIIIDDDATANLLCGIIIKHILGRDTKIKTFVLADHAVNYLKEIPRDAGWNTVVFLDINMPVTTGWDALKLLDKLDEDLKKQLTIFMFSSSIDPNDKLRAMANPLVFDFIEKPLTIDTVERIFVH